MLHPFYFMQAYPEFLITYAIVKPEDAMKPVLSV